MADDVTDLKTLRTDQLGMSQKAFAEWFDVDQSTVSLWERKGPPSRGLAKESFDRRLKALIKSKSRAA